MKLSTLSGNNRQYPQSDFKCYCLITSRYSNKVVGAVFIIILIIVTVGLATMKNEYKECAGMCPVGMIMFLIFYSLFEGSLSTSSPGGGTLGISGWGCAAGTLEPLAYTRATCSSAEFCYPIQE